MSILWASGVDDFRRIVWMVLWMSLVLVVHAQFQMMRWQA